MSVPAYDQLCHECRIGEGKGQHQVDQQESRTAIARGLGREPPDIAEADGTAGRCHDKAESRAEFTPGRCHSLVHQCLSYCLSQYTTKAAGSARTRG